MNKVRRLDNLAARWMMRHFYILFFQIVLVIIFGVWFFITLRIIDIAYQTPQANTVEKLLSVQTLSLATIGLLMLLNSFWMLYMFNGINRLRSVLKDISYQISKMRTNPRHLPCNK
jgi:hypothetical protein